MTKKILLAAAFCGALAFAGLGTPSQAEAAGCYPGGAGFYGRAPAFGYGGFYAPRRASFYRGFSRGPAFGYGYAPYGFRTRGVTFGIGF